MSSCIIDRWIIRNGLQHICLEQDQVIDEINLGSCVDFVLLMIQVLIPRVLIVTVFVLLVFEVVRVAPRIVQLVFNLVVQHQMKILF